MGGVFTDGADIVHGSPVAGFGPDMPDRGGQGNPEKSAGGEGCNTRVRGGKGLKWLGVVSFVKGILTFATVRSTALGMCGIGKGRVPLSCIAFDGCRLGNETLTNGATGVLMHRLKDEKVTQSDSALSRADGGSLRVRNV